MKTTNTIILICTSVFILCNVLADEVPGPDEHVFAITSPSNLFYAVQSFGVIPTEGPQKAKMRFQVFSTDTGALKWECARSFGTQTSVLLADDGEHVISLPYWVLADGRALISMRDVNVPAAVRAQMADQFRHSISGFPVVVFYKRDKVIRKVFFHELEIPLDRIEDVSANHVRLHAQRFDHFYTCLWECTPQCERFRRTELKSIYKERPTTEGNNITVAFVDGKNRTFDYTTGKLLKTEDAEQENPSFSPVINDPFSNTPPIKERLVHPVGGEERR